jgi:hypothetical protein
MDGPINRDMSGGGRPLQGREFGRITARFWPDQRPILGPEAAVQRDEPETVGIRQISTRSRRS